jgi:hypothetical protein
VYHNFKSDGFFVQHNVRPSLMTSSSLQSSYIMFMYYTNDKLSFICDEVSVQAVHHPVGSRHFSSNCDEKSLGEQALSCLVARNGVDI